MTVSLEPAQTPSVPNPAALAGDSTELRSFEPLLRLRHGRKRRRRSFSSLAPEYEVSAVQLQDETFSTSLQAFSVYRHQAVAAETCHIVPGPNDYRRILANTRPGMPVTEHYDRVSPAADRTR